MAGGERSELSTIPLGLLQPRNAAKIPWHLLLYATHRGDQNQTGMFVITSTCLAAAASLAEREKETWGWGKPAAHLSSPHVFQGC